MSVGRVVLLLALSGCAYLRPTFAPEPWDAYGDRGPLRVRGTPPGTAGRMVFESLAREPRLRSLLASEGEPDTLEVRGGRLAPKEIVLVYPSRTGRRARRIVLDATSAGVVARAPEPIARPVAQRVPSRARAAPPSERPSRPAQSPTVAQTLECPIDPTRQDCRALCAADAAHEWCARP